ncbi:MAG: C40 family peptidase [Oscillochloridaceae bacterium umkhey_bin13]
MGQRVEIWPFHVQAQAVAGPFVTAPGVAADRQQLALIMLTWHNHTLDPLPVQYSEQVRLRAVTDPNGALVSDGRWGVSAQALQLAGIAALPTTVPPGLSTVTIPVIGPRGTPHVVELSLFADPDALPRIPTTTTLPGTPTSTALIVPPTATPSPNQDLRVLRTEPLTLQWSAATWQAPGAPPCPDPGALTDWEAEPLQVWGREVAIRGVAAPPGAERLVQIALAQVGKPYVWGAKGPERFDCSGLMSWTYAQIGLVIPQGTAGQWPRMRSVTSADLRPGDLVFFAIAGGGIDHVGMLVGDLNGDGEWDLVHAASPRLGVRVDYNIFSSSYYAPRIRGFRTAR